MDQGMNIYPNQYVTNRCNGIIHVVKEGDTLYKIGKMHGVSVSALMYANPYVNVYNLQIGDELCVPIYPMQPGMEREPMRENRGGNTAMPQNAPTNASTPAQEIPQRNATGLRAQDEVMAEEMSRLEYEIADDSEL